MTTTNLSIAADQARKISQAISRIYHFTQGGAIADFSQQALTQLAALIDIDSSCWLVLTGEHPLTAVTGYSYGNGDDLPDGFITGFDALITDEQLDQMQLRCGETVIFPTTDGDGSYHKHLQHYEIQQQIVSLHQHDNTRHLIVLNRKSQTVAFDDSQRVLLNFMASSLVNAFHLSLQTKLARHRHYWRSYNAICDQHGHIIEQQQGFITTLRNNRVDWDGRRLPNKLKHDPIKINVSKNDGFYIAEAYHFDKRIESLTRTEFQIAQLLLKAKTNKEMAQILNAKDKTIDNHLQNIFTKLDVKTRTAALTKLRNSDYCFDDLVAQ